MQSKTIITYFTALFFYLITGFVSYAEDDLLKNAAQGNVDEVKKLITQGQNIDIRDSRGRTPLLLATLNNHPEVAKLLIEAGADVNAKDNTQESPYLLSGALGRTQILEMTLKHGADIRSLNGYLGTALIPAAERGHAETAKVLIAAGVDVDHVNRLGWTALLEAIILGSDNDSHVNIVEQLIKAGANINLPDRNGSTPLQLAKQKGYKRIAAVLEAAGAK